MTKFQKQLLAALDGDWRNPKQIRQRMIEQGASIMPNHPLSDIETVLIAIAKTAPGVSRRQVRNQHGRIRSNLFRLASVDEVSAMEMRRVAG
ncbi:hypothetical protein [Ferrimonas aestuarii]|uniref:Uncharacterized protein n=1 Tax=Ferrimonas aestuarii TaxID=2569539 RepID=A0A4U1BLV9_9GAMM|nr:hypothetical protein [Ferrimonas aestuarii]TKB53287.1 hypothetical protein FCL42_14540 [Ferrimonas aestuarii]